MNLWCKLFYSIISFISLISLCVYAEKDLNRVLQKKSATSGTSSHNRYHYEIPIRVLLDKQDKVHHVGWTLSTEDHFIIVGVHKGKKIKLKCQANTLHITVRNNLFWINGKKYEYEALMVFSVKPLITFKNHNYEGVLVLTCDENNAYIVNHVDLEDYVASVSLSESWPGWPDEVNKALSVVFRSYGIAKVLEQRAFRAKRGISLPYDIQNTSFHQVYRGQRDAPYFKRVDYYKNIVNQTKGIVLAYDNRPILAMFDICCGGVIPSRKKGIDFIKAPYLARAYPCYYCNKYTFYTWQVCYDIKEVETHIKKQFPKFGTLKEIKIVRKDNAGIVQEIKVRGNGGWISLSGNHCKTLLKNIKSLCFSLIKKGSQVIFEGKGHGHLIGLCQRGARQLVQEGWGYKNILKFYYPGASFMKLQKSKR